MSDTTPVKPRDAETELDTSGLLCPEPLMLLRNKVRAMAKGQVLHVVATDPSTERDFTNFCRFMNHKLLRCWQANGKHHYLIRKGS
jgi:tRNA 2-thiouridine synthesizing protein A